MHSLAHLCTNACNVHSTPASIHLCMHGIAPLHLCTYARTAPMQSPTTQRRLDCNAVCCIWKTSHSILYGRRVHVPSQLPPAHGVAKGASTGTLLARVAGISVHFEGAVAPPSNWPLVIGSAALGPSALTPGTWSSDGQRASPKQHSFLTWRALLNAFCGGAGGGGGACACLRLVCPSLPNLCTITSRHCADCMLL